MKNLIYIFLPLLLCACSSDIAEKDALDAGTPFHISSDVTPFDGEVSSRATLEGNAFMVGDLIRVKIICPFVSGSQRGESTNSSSPDGLYYLKAIAGSSDGNEGWAYLTGSDGFDINGDYAKSGSPRMSSYQEAQQTPYVFTADTWSEEKHFVVNSTLYIQQTSVFHHDQRKQKHHLASDVLWAQTIMQTGGTNVHLGFQHKMACLDITVNDADETDNAVLTLEKMPNIDQAEIVIGNYYADDDIYSTRYGYKQKHSCEYSWNGHVLGVAVIDEAAPRAKIRLLPGCTKHGGSNTKWGDDVRTNGTYTAYKVARNHYRLIVPPCTLPENAVFWFRDGERRYSVVLQNTTFEEGKLYPITLNFE